MNYLRPFTEKELNCIKESIKRSVFAEDIEVLSRPKLFVLLDDGYHNNNLNDIVIAIAEDKGKNSGVIPKSSKYKFLRNADLETLYKDQELTVKPLSWWENKVRPATKAEVRFFLSGRNHGDLKRTFRPNDIYKVVKALKRFDD